MQITHLRATPHDANSPGNAFASVRSSVSKLSVNQPTPERKAYGPHHAHSDRAGPFLRHFAMAAASSFGWSTMTSCPLGSLMTTTLVRRYISWQDAGPSHRPR